MNYVMPPINKNVKVIINIYDMVYKKFPNTMMLSNLYLLRRDMNRSVKRADAIVTVSENSKKEIIEHFNVSPQKVHIIPPGIEYGEFSKGMNITTEKVKEIRKKYKLPLKYFLYLGTVEPRKNIPTIFKAYSALPNHVKNEYKLVIAGGKGWKSKNIYSVPSALNIDDKVIFTGYVDENDKPYIYGLSEVFLFPSLYEGFGLPVVEAMCSGVPVITANNSSLVEVGGNAASFVDCMDYLAICREIQKLISDKDYYSQKVQKGLTHVQKFTWQKSANLTIELYKKIME